MWKLLNDSDFGVRDREGCEDFKTKDVDLHPQIILDIFKNRKQKYKKIFFNDVRYGTTIVLFYFWKHFIFEYILQISCIKIVCRTINNYSICYFIPRSVIIQFKYNNRNSWAEKKHPPPVCHQQQKAPPPSKTLATHSVNFSLLLRWQSLARKCYVK